MLSEACNIQGFEDIACDWNGNRGKARHSFLKVNLCTTENQEALLSHMERKSVSFEKMAPLTRAPLHIVESKKELVVNKAKQADENELAEFTMSWPPGAQHEELSLPLRIPRTVSYGNPFPRSQSVGCLVFSPCC